MIDPGDALKGQPPLHQHTTLTLHTLQPIVGSANGASAISRSIISVISQCQTAPLKLQQNRRVTQ